MRNLTLTYSTLFLVLLSCGSPEDNGIDKSENLEKEEITLESAVIIEEDENLDTLKSLNCEDFKLFAFLSDPDDSETNVRISPGGDILTTLSPDDEFELTIDQVDNSWFKVIEIYSFNEGDNLILTNGFGWIHGTVIGLNTRNYGGEKIPIYSSNSQNSEVVTWLHEETFVRPKNACGNWVEIEFEKSGKKINGWIQNKWLCGSPVTNCS